VTNSANALLVRALRGPLTLILIGSLFVIDHSGGISFTKTWPIIIIFLGCVKLAERALGGVQPPGPPPNPPYPQYPTYPTQGGAQ